MIGAHFPSLSRARSSCSVFLLLCLSDPTMVELSLELDYVMFGY